MKRLDLCFGGELDSEISPDFNSLSMDLRVDFNSLVTDMSRPFIHNLDWWLQGPASRNTYASPLFHYFCCFHLVKNLAEEGFKYQSIVVDSQAFAQLVSDLLSDRGVDDVNIRINKYSFNKQLKNKLKLPVLFFRKIFQHFFIRASAHQRDDVKKDSFLNLIDTFMIPGYESNDRWYGDLWNEMPDYLRVDTFFVPTFVLTPLRKIFSSCRKLRCNKRNFLIREDYLRMADYIYAFNYKRRLKVLSPESVLICGYDFSEVIREEIANTPDVLTIIESLLVYRSIKRLKESGVKVRLAIDWFEGQVIDKAWNFGFNTFYPKAFTVGYRAFESYPFYLCSYPLPIEMEAKVLPREIAVQGAGTISTVREFFELFDVMVIPSFKSQHVWSCKYEENQSGEYSILVALPISLLISGRIVKQLLQSYCKIVSSHPKIKFVIKPHPTHATELVKSNLPELPEFFMITKEKSLPKLLHKSNLLITEASSACLEALACGIPVIIMENNYGLTFDPVPKTVSETIVKRSRTEEQLVRAMLDFISDAPKARESYRRQGKQIRSDYFEPVSLDGINRFFKVETNH